MERIQLRRDLAAKWTEINPILMEGEVGFEIDTKLRKIGDGVTAWNNLDYLAAENVVQELGDSTTAVISQNIITNEINTLKTNVGIDVIPDFVIGKCVRRYAQDPTSLYVQTIANYISYAEGIKKKYLYKKGMVVKLSDYNIAEFTLQYSYDGINWIEKRRLREDFTIDKDMYLFINIGYQNESKVVASVEELLQYLSFFNPISNENLYLEQNNISNSLTKLTSDVESIPVEKSKNLWTLGDLEYTKSTIIYLDNPIPIGTYTLSAIVTANNVIQENSKIEIYQERIVSSEYITNAILKHDGKRNNTVIELTSPAKAMVFYTGLNSATSPSNSTAKWVDILLEEGNTPTIYFEDTTCVDYVSRGNIDILKTELVEQTEKIALIEEKINGGIVTIEDLKDTIIYGGVFTEETKDNEKLVSIWVTPDVYERRPLIVVIDSKYTKEEGVTAYPYIQSVIQPEGYDYRSTKYKLGNEAKFRMQEVRMIPYPWGNTPCRVSIVVPAGITLEIRDLYSYYSDSIVRTTDGLRFNARTGSCNICPDETLSEMQMAYTLGYNAVIVIPKVSSDGVWFAYHDDTFNLSSTILRNSDGSQITDTTYNGKYMHEIPWTYLSTLLVEPHKKTSPLRHETLMTIEEYLFFCAKTGIQPIFSMHPVTGVQTQDNLKALRSLVSKYNLLDKLALKFPYVDAIDNLSNVFKVFGNDIYAYEIDSSTALTSSDFRYFNNIGITTRRVIEYEVKCFIGSSSEQLISTAKSMGWSVASYIVGSFTFGDVKSHSIFHGEDIRRLASMGVTEFTDDFNTSNGLNW